MVSCLVILIFATVNIVGTAVQTVFDYINTYIYCHQRYTHTHAHAHEHAHAHTHARTHTHTHTHVITNVL